MYLLFYESYSTDNGHLVYIFFGLKQKSQSRSTVVQNFATSSYSNMVVHLYVVFSDFQQICRKMPHSETHTDFDLLKLLQIAPPNVQQGEQYWRIPSYLTRDGLKAKASFLQHAEDEETDELNSLLEENGMKVPAS